MIPRRLSAHLAALLLVVGLVSYAQPAAADTGLLDVQVTSVSTPVLDLSNPAQVVEVKGTITNTSTVSVREAVVHFWRLPTPIRSSERLAGLLSDVPIGARITAEESLFQFPKDAPFEPGQRTTFTVKATIAQLTTGNDALTQDNAAYLIGAQVRGIPDDASRAIVGSDVFPITATKRPVTSSAVVTLTATPSWLPDSTFVDASLADDLANRLEELLASAERPGVVAAVDPALYAAAKRMSAEHVVDGEDTAGNGVALRWVARVDALAAEGRLWRLPYGNPDLSRADSSGQLEQVLAWSDEAGREVLPGLDSVAIVPGASKELVDALASFDTVIVPGVTGARPGPPRVFGAISDDADRPVDGTATQARITEEFLATRPPLYVIDSPGAADFDAELAWRTHVEPSATPAEPLGWGDPAEPKPWPKVAEALTRANEDISLLEDLTAAPSSINRAELGANAWSAGFGSEAAAVAYVKESTPEQVNLNKITFRAAASFVMGSRTNKFPATVTNGLTVPVTVGVRFHSDSPQRVRVPDLKPQTILPGESLTLDVTPEASINGVALVRAQVVTTSGISVGKPATIEITATDFGRVGWIIIVVSGAVLLGGTAWRIRAVRRERAKASLEENE